MTKMNMMKTQLVTHSLKDANICIVGNLNIDLIIRNVPHLPDWGQEVLGNNYILVSSGQSAYTAFALSKYQVPTSLIGNVGDDIYGEKITNDLNRFGLNIVAVEKVSGGNTGITVAIVRKDGERAFVSDPSSLVTFDRSLVERHMHLVINANITCVVGIFFLPNFKLEDVQFVCRESKNAGRLTLLDTGWDPDNWQKKTVKDLRSTLQFVDFFIPNMDEAKAITGKNDPEQAARDLIEDGCGTVIIKLGEKGSYLLSSDQSIYVPSFNVNVFDAVGAGDVFNAGFIFGTLQGWPMEARMIFGSATSALYISKPDDRFPELDQSIKLANTTEQFNFVYKDIP